jgi:ABC-2 type transport system permease protein
MFRTVVQYELRLLFRSPLVWISLLVYLAIGLLAVNRGAAFVAYQQQEADSLIAQHRLAYTRLQQAFDTLDFSVKERHAIESPWSLDWQLKEYAIRPTHPLAIYSIGQGDVFARIKSTRFNAEVFSSEQDEFRNPDQLLAGNLDLSYFLLFLFPILFIALAHNVISADKEGGISRLLGIQSVHPMKVYRYRVITRCMVSVLPFWLAFLFGFLYLPGQSAFPVSHWGIWIAISVLYILLWLGIVWAVVQRGWNSMINILVLAGIWLFLLVGLPGILNSWIQLAYPDVIKSDVLALRDEKEQFYELPVSVHRAAFIRRDTSRKLDIDAADTMILKYGGYALMSFEREQEIHRKRVQQAAQMLRMESSLFWINPVGAAMRGYAEAAGTSLRQQMLFEEHLMQHRGKKLLHLFVGFMEGEHLDNRDFKAMPRYEAIAYPAEGLWSIFLPLLFFVGLSWGIAAGGSRKSNLVL